MPMTSASKPGGLAGAPMSIETFSCWSGAPAPPSAAGGLALEVDHQRVALADAAFHRLEPRGAFAQPLERLFTASSSTATAVRRSWMSPKSPGSKAGTTSKLAVKRERLALFDDHVLDVGGVDRLHALGRQHLVDGARDEVVGDVVENLGAEALAHDRRRHLAGAEPGQPRRLGVLAGDPVDGRLHLGRRESPRPGSCASR